MNIKEWWSGLNQREQSLVSVMTVIIGLFLFVTLVWQPLNDNIDKARSKVEKQQEFASWVTENIAVYKQLQGTGSKRASGSLSSIVNRSARQLSITIARMQPQGDDLQVWVDELPFNDLLHWLENLTEKDGLRIMAIDVVPGNNSGTVKIKRLQVAKG